MYTADVENNLRLIEKQIKVAKHEIEKQNQVDCLKDIFCDFLSEIEYHLDEIEKFIYNINN